MKVGWAKLSLDPSTELGVDGNSYAFDGFGVCILCFVYYLIFSLLSSLPQLMPTNYFMFIQGRKWNHGAEPYGKQWRSGDVIGCMLDLNDKTISKCCTSCTLFSPTISLHFLLY